MSMAVDTATRPDGVTPARPASPPAPGSPRRTAVAAGAAGLVLLLAGAAVVATWPQPARPHQASSTNSSTDSSTSSSTDSSGLVGRAAPSSAASPAVPGARPAPAGAGRSAGSGARTAGATPGPTWTSRDPAVLSAQTAAYFIAGTIYGDPPGNRPGIVTISSAAATHLRRGATSGATLDQLRQAVQALGGQASVSRGQSGGGKAAFTLPAGRTIVLDTHGSVRINGVDAFGLRRTATGWTSTATGPQVRAFLAGFIEGEGSVSGKIGDDPTAAHLAFVQALMSTSQAYGVRTVLTGTSYFALTVASKADFAKVQAYPFITYGRCPGGQP